MDIQGDIQKVKELVEKAQDVLVVTHENPSSDSIGASLALYLGLISLGKRATIACPDPVTVGLSNFIGANKVTQEVGKKNFIISLDYVDGSIEKVSYNIEGDKFNLVVEPRPGFEPFSQDKVHYTTAGAGYDVIFSVDTIHLGGLKALYEGQKDLFATKPVVNIDRHPNNSMYGQLNIVNTLASSTAELTALVLSGLGVKLTEDIATNLLNALYGATNAFQNPAITSTAFEVASVAVKAGGKRFMATPQQTTQELPVVSPKSQPSIDIKQQKPVATQPEEQVSPQVQAQAKTPDKTPVQAPADWLKPKIFKSSTLL